MGYVLLSVVIPTCNEWANLIWTLQALIDELEGIDYEIIVVANKCTDETADQVKRRRHPNIKLLTLDNVQSHWQARNLGAKEATGDHILFCDSHVTPRPGSFKRAYEYHQDFDGLLNFGLDGFCDNKKRTAYQYTWNRSKFWGAWTRTPPDETWNILCSGGAAYMVDTAVFLDSKGFHPSLGIYGGGEPYLQIKLQRLGYDHKVNPEWSVRHLAMRRGYSFNNDNFWFNFLLASWAVGGVEAQEPYYLGLLNKLKSKHEGDVLNNYVVNLMRIRDNAISEAEQDRQWINSRSVRSYLDVVRGGKCEGR